MTRTGSPPDALPRPPRSPPAAAGCGDKSMALKLVELGTDVNCKDSVGGEAGVCVCGVLL